METAEILQQFERFEGKFARAAVEAAVARREEVTPELLRILEDTVDWAAQLDAEGHYMAHLYAMFLLAQFRETRAYPLVVRLASLPGDLLDSLCGDFITEDLGQILASVCGGELEGIQSVIENEDADEWARGAALNGLVTLVAAGHKSRDEIVSYLARLFRGKLTRQWSHVWDTLVCYSSDLYPAELLDDIERAYKEGLVDPGYIGFDHVKRDLAMGKDRVLARLANDPHLHLVEDTVKEMGWWACFRGARQVADRFHLTLNLRQAVERELAVRRSFLLAVHSQEHTRDADGWRHGNREQGETDLNPIQRAAATRRSRPTPAAAKARVVSHDPAHEEGWHEGEPNRAPSRHQPAAH